MKCVVVAALARRCLSPLAEGRELKSAVGLWGCGAVWSPLAEGRELKYADAVADVLPRESPLAEGRELKFAGQTLSESHKVAPRGGA